MWCGWSCLCVHACVCVCVRIVSVVLYVCARLFTPATDGYIWRPRWIPDFSDSNKLRCLAFMVRISLELTFAHPDCLPLCPCLWHQVHYAYVKYQYLVRSMLHRFSTPCPFSTPTWVQDLENETKSKLPHSETQTRVN